MHPFWKIISIFMFIWKVFDAHSRPTVHSLPCIDICVHLFKENPNFQPVHPCKRSIISHQCPHLELGPQGGGYEGGGGQPPPGGSAAPGGQQQERGILEQLVCSLCTPICKELGINLDPEADQGGHEAVRLNQPGRKRRRRLSRNDHLVFSFETCRRIGTIIVFGHILNFSNVNVFFFSALDAVLSSYSYFF